MAQLGGNTVQIIIQGVDKTNPAANTAGANMAKMGKLASQAARAVEASAVAAAAGLVILAKQAINNADEVGKMAQSFGASTQFLSAFDHAAGLSNVTTEQSKTGFRDLNEEIKKNGSALRELGIATRDSNGNLRSIQDVIPEIADKFADMADGAQKAQLASELFGKKVGADLIPLLNQGSKGLREAADEARKFGLIVDGQSAAAAEEFNDALTKFQLQLKGIGMALARETLPLLLEWTKEIQKLIDEQGLLDGTMRTVRDSIRYVNFEVNSLVHKLGLLSEATQLSFNSSLIGMWSKGFNQATQDGAKNVEALFEKLKNPPPLPKLFEEPSAGPVTDMSAKRGEPTSGGDSKFQDIDDLTWAWEDHYARMQELDMGRQEFRSAQHALDLESVRDAYSYAAEFSMRFHEGLSSTLTDVIMGTKDAKEAFKDLGRSMIQMVVNFMAQRTVAWALEKVLSAVGTGVMKASSVAAIGMASSVASAWAAAATASAIATGGSTLAAGAGVPALMATNAAMGSAIALAGGMGGIAHGGLEYVPAESTFLLQRGERVLSPNQNADFTEALENGMLGGSGGGMNHFHIHVDGREFLDFIHDASASGELTIRSKAIVT